MSNRIVSAPPQLRGDTNPRATPLSLPARARHLAGVSSLTAPRPSFQNARPTFLPGALEPKQTTCAQASTAASARAERRDRRNAVNQRQGHETPRLAPLALALFLLTAPAHAVTVQPHVFADGTTLLDAANMWSDPDHYAPGDKAWTAVERPEPQHGYCWYMRQLGLHVQRDPVDWERRCQVYAQPTETHRNPFGPPLGGGGGSSTPSPVPLPASAWLLIAGLLSLFAIRRRSA